MKENVETLSKKLTRNRYIDSRKVKVWDSYICGGCMNLLTITALWSIMGSNPFLGGVFFGLHSAHDRIVDGC